MEMRKPDLSFRRRSIANNNLMTLYRKESLYYLFYVTHAIKVHKNDFLIFSATWYLFCYLVHYNYEPRV
jgi:hypothetical protein